MSASSWALGAECPPNPDRHLRSRLPLKVVRCALRFALGAPRSSVLGERRHCLRSRPEVIPRRRARGVHVRGVHLKGPRQAFPHRLLRPLALAFPRSDGARASGALGGLDDPPGDFRQCVPLRLLYLPLDILARLGAASDVTAKSMLSEAAPVPSPSPI